MQIYNKYVSTYINRWGKTLFFLTAFLLQVSTFSTKAESVNEIFMRIKSKEIYAFNKIENPSSLDSLEYLRNLANISYNYCDSTTTAYHKDIIIKIFDVYPILKNYPHISDEVEEKLLTGIINIYFAEDTPFNNNKDVLLKLYNVAFNIICNLYSQMDEENKSFCIELVTCSYLEESIRKDIVQLWRSKIISLDSPSAYITASTFLHNLLGYLSSNGKYETAIELEQIILVKCQEYFSDSSEYYYDCLQYLSVSYFNANNYPKAIDLQKKIVEWNVANHIADKDLKIELRNLRHGLFTMGHYQEARKYGERLVNCYDTKSSIDYINDCSALAYCIFYSGEEELAISMLKEILKQEEEVAPQNMASSYSSFSTLLRLNNDMVNSIKYAKLALSLCNKDSQEYDELRCQYHALINLGAAYYTLNDILSSIAVLKKADLLYNELINLRKFDKERIEADIILSAVLARDYIISNQIEGAEMALNKALKIAKDYYKEENVHYLKIYAILADLHLIKNDRLSALNIYNYVLKHLDPCSRIYYSYLSGYSDYCINLGLYEEALDAIKKAFYRTNSTIDLIKLSRLEFHFKQYDSMREHLRIIFEQNRNLVNESFLTYNNMQRKSYWWGAYVGEWFQNDLPTLIISSNSTDSLSIRTLYDATIFSKGILLSTESDVRNLILNSNNTDLICKYNRLLRLDKKNNNPDEFRDYSLFMEESQLESELMQYIRQHSSSISALNVSSKDIQNMLNHNSIAVEFLSVRIDTTAALNYYALILEPNETCEPRLIKLFSSNQLDMINPEKYYTTKSLTKLIWEPLLDYIQKYDTIYFAPCEILNNIAIEHLPYIEGNGYMTDSLVIYRLSNTRELVSPQHKVKISGIGLFGGMIYNTDLTNMDVSQKAIQKLQDNVESNRSGHSYLPNSKIEVEIIDSIMQSYNINSYIYTGLNGTEENFKNMCSQKTPEILHIATHGIYYSNEDIDDNPEYSKLPFIKRSVHNNFYTEDLALTQSFLLFTGSDTSNKGDDRRASYNDGILTAQEITTLNLKNTDLVVLSACQSGLGEIKGDGIFGLQRGFKKAGVKSLLMSLWDVDDNATQILMINFYNNLLSGMSKREALHKAQTTLRHNANYSNPYYWAAFILLDGLN